jgi:predicted dehydrogenase
MDKPLRIAVLGCGSIGRRHLRNLSQLGGCDLYAFDLVPSALETAHSETNAVCFSDLDRLWEQQPDVAIITTPSNLHVELALEAAKHNCPLFIEKPVSHTLDGLDELCAEAEQRGLITMVGCNMRFHPGPAQVKQLLDEAAIGQVVSARIHTGSYLPGWRPGTDYRQSYSAQVALGGGVILDCIHEIDLALWYFGPGEVLAAVSLPATSIGLAVEGLAEILIRHRNEVLSSVHLNFIQRDYQRSCEVIGSDGSIYWNFSEGKVRCYRPHQDVQVIDQPADWTVNQMFVDEIRYFLDCVRTKTQSVNNLQCAMDTLKLALAAKAYPQKVEIVRS